MADPHVLLVAALLTSKGALKARVGVGGGQPGRSGNGPVDRQTDRGIVGRLGLGVENPWTRVSIAVPAGGPANRAELSAARRTCAGWPETGCRPVLRPDPQLPYDFSVFGSQLRLDFSHLWR